MSPARAAVCLTADLVPTPPAAPGWLDADQRARLARLVRPGDRDDFVAARVLARRLLGSPGLVVRQRCERCGGPHGRPEVVGRPDLHLSWAHADGLVAAAVSTAPVGVDVERVVPGERPPAPSPHAVGLDAVGAWLGWTRVEALVKRGDADLDEALTWPLAGPPGLTGTQVAGLVPGGRPGVLTDLVGDADGWVATVAGVAAATWIPVPAAGPPPAVQPTTTTGRAGRR